MHSVVPLLYITRKKLVVQVVQIVVLEQASQPVIQVIQVLAL